jgi:hypothetical protein
MQVKCLVFVRQLFNIMDMDEPFVRTTYDIVQVLIVFNFCYPSLMSMFGFNINAYSFANSFYWFHFLCDFWFLFSLKNIIAFFFLILSPLCIFLRSNSLISCCSCCPFSLEGFFKLLLILIINFLIAAVFSFFKKELKIEVAPVPVILREVIFGDYSQIITNKKRFVFLSACFLLIFFLFNHDIIINVAYSVVPIIVLKAQWNGKKVFNLRNGGCRKFLSCVFIKINCPIRGSCNKSF